MRISIIVLLGCCLASGLSRAQSFQGIGLRLGGNLASGTFNTVEQVAQPGTDYSYKRSALAGYQVGVAASFGSGHWALQPALVFTQKGVKQRLLENTNFGGYDFTVDFSVNSRVHYLELPLNVVYGFGADGEGFQVFAGPYVAVGVGGRTDFELTETTTNPNYPEPHTKSGSAGMAFGNTFSEEPSISTPSVDWEGRARRFDAGVNFGVGYRQGPIQVQLGYGLGLLNVQPAYPASYDMPNDTGHLRTAQLTATYYFGPGK